MKQILYSLLLFSVIISNANAKNIDSLRNVFEQSDINRSSGIQYI